MLLTKRFFLKTLTDALHSQDSRWGIRLDERLTQQDKKWSDRLDQRFAQQDKKWDNRLDQRFAQQDKKWDNRLDQRLDVRLQQQYEKICVMLIKHFYTKDETDKKLSDLRSDLKADIRRNGVIIEDVRSNFRATAEGYSHITKRVDSHEKRIISLETSI